MKRKIINLSCFLILLLFGFIGCIKKSEIISEDSSGEIEKLAAWYQRQIIPTNDSGAFANINTPKWESTKIIKIGDSIMFTTLLLQDSSITRELQVAYHDGLYEGVIRQYQFKNNDSLIVGSFTLNGRYINHGFFDRKNKYTLLGMAGKRNIVLMGIEDIDGGTLPVVDVPGPPKPPTTPPTWPTTPPPPPTWPSDPNNSGGGDSNSPNPTPKLAKVSSPDPCNTRSSVNSRLNKSSILSSAKAALSKTKNNLVNGKKVEYGFETVLTNLTTFDFKNNITKSGNESNINLDTRWNYVEGYTVGYTHSHPNNSAPSPSDLFKGSSYYKNWSSYNLPVSERTIYTDYYSSTVVTDDFVYVITIKNPEKWGNALDLSDQQARNIANKRYRELATDYMRSTQQFDDTNNGSLYALLTMYGDAVNIYRSSNASTFDFVPLEIALGGIVIKRC